MNVGSTFKIVQECENWDATHLRPIKLGLFC